jgi:NAD(P)-dependent dehydrogenase (short-subunit alcohol dehydrogenase family)
LAKNGYKVILTARRLAELEATLSEVVAVGGRGSLFVCDLSSKVQVQDLISFIKKSCASLYAIINVAGVWHGADKVYAGINFEDFDQSVIVETVNVGLLAPMLLIHGLLPSMGKGSKIINISGTFDTGAKGWVPYYVSKKGIESLTIGLSEDLLEKEIEVNCISPSDTATDEYKKYFPEYIEYSLLPEEVAGQVLLLCEGESEFNTGKVIELRKTDHAKSKNIS